MLRKPQIIRSCAIAAGCVVLAPVSLFGPPAEHARAASSSPSVDSEPISAAAAFIGVPASTLATDIVNETRRTGTLGIHVAIDQLDTAMARQLSALPPTTDDGVIMAHHFVIASHHTIHDALLDQAVTVLHGALRG